MLKILSYTLPIIGVITGTILTITKIETSKEISGSLWFFIIIISWVLGWICYVVDELTNTKQRGTKNE